MLWEEWKKNIFYIYLTISLKRTILCRWGCKTLTQTKSVNQLGSYRCQKSSLNLGFATDSVCMINANIEVVKECYLSWLVTISCGNICTHLCCTVEADSAVFAAASIWCCLPVSLSEYSPYLCQTCSTNCGQMWHYAQNQKYVKYYNTGTKLWPQATCAQNLMKFVDLIFNTGICLQTVIHIFMVKTFQFTTKCKIDCWVIAVKQQKSK